MGSHQKGFTLMELMIVIAIIGIISTVVIGYGPQYIQRAKQQATMKEMKTIADACMTYLSVHGEAPALDTQKGILEVGSDFVKALVPAHLTVLPTKDKWKNAYIVYTGKSCANINGLDTNMIGDLDFVIISYGRDGLAEDFTYNPADSEAGRYEINTIQDYDKDLILWNMSWIKLPAMK